MPSWSLNFSIKACLFADKTIEIHLSLCLFYLTKINRGIRRDPIFLRIP